MKKLLLPLIFLSASVLAQKNHDGLVFSPSEFDFGKAENWVSSVDTIEVTNTTHARIFLLRQKYPREFEVRLPDHAIEPGKTELMEVIFKPTETGKFNFTLPIYHSASADPVNLTFKGNIVSFDEFANVACPSFSRVNLRPVDFEMEVAVVDSATRNPIGNSFLEITKGEFYTQHHTGADGSFRQRSDIGYYIVLAEHPGYKSRAVAKHVNPKNRKIVVALPAEEQKKPVLPQEEPPVLVKKDTVIRSNPDPARIENAPPPVTDASFSLADYKKNNIVFLIDRSSSMSKPDCMPLLQEAMTELAKMTRPEDRITIITYSNDAKVMLAGVPGNEHRKMIDVIQQLKCGGKTEGGKAVHAAYKNAEENFIKDGVNQIILATDGGFNGLSEDPDELMRLVGAKAKDGIRLSVLSFGQNRYGKVHIERLSKQGEGFYVFIANESDAQAKLPDTIRQQSKIK